MSRYLRRGLAAWRQWRQPPEFRFRGEGEPDATAAASLESHLLRGKLLAQQGRYEEAIAAWSEVIRREPNHREAQAALARADRIAFGRWGAVARYSGSYLATITAASAAVVALMIYAARAEQGPVGGSSLNDSSAPPTHLIAAAAAALPKPGVESKNRPQASPAAPNPSWEPRIQSLESELQSAVRRMEVRLQLLELRSAAFPSNDQENASGDAGQAASLHQRIAALERQMEEALGKLDARLRQRESATQAPEGLAPAPGAADEDATHDRLQTVTARMDNLAARLDEFEKKLARASDRSMELRRDILMWRAYDLSIQTPITESQLSLVEEICTELSDAKYDPLTRQYAQELLQWVARQK